MLSEAEQRRLAEIETSLRMDYPRLARHFAARAKPWTWRTWPGAGVLLLIVAAVVSTVVGFVLGSIASVVVASAVAGMSVAAWAGHRRSVWRDCR
jgi:hypothetical protein